MGISDRGTKAKNITSCDNAFVTNIGAAAASLSRKKHLLARDPAAKRMFSVRKRSANVAAATKRLIGRPQEALLCAKAKRQQQMFYLCESEASATKRPAGTEINHTLL
ncbi:hypothetical protein ACQKOF_00875 [Lysinibacillus sp. NPDC093190]|uniref:hypothetical protein n=1 Tax=Lysinibacillus sp. NPDC093190 TaxID=3390575 RepID=UPI003D040489